MSFQCLPRSRCLLLWLASLVLQIVVFPEAGTPKPRQPTSSVPAKPTFFHGGDGGTTLPLHVGAGCIISNYSALPVVTGTGVDSPPSFRATVLPGFGTGQYVVHFTAFQIPVADLVIIRGVVNGGLSADTSVVSLAGSNATGGFYAQSVSGIGIELSLYRTTESPPLPTQTAKGVPCYGFQIDNIVFQSAAAEAEIESVTSGSMDDANGSQTITSEIALASSGDILARAHEKTYADESLCGEDESVELACAKSQAMVNASQAVARIVISKDSNMDVAYCTAFLLGCEGHLITNQHCIGSFVDALNTVFEFHAQAAKCGENCTSRSACSGDVIVRSATLVAVSETLDYALVRLVNPVNSTPAIEAAEPLLKAVGGYLQFRATGPEHQEEIYIPQHPLGYGTRIAWLNNGQPGRIESLTVDACRAGDVGYYVDTQEGSSGSPIIAVKDNAVVALHHCGGCLNGAIPSTELIADMKAKGVLPACAVRDDNQQK